MFFSISNFAAEQELTLKPKGDGQPSFGIQYSYDSDFSWTFTYTTTISNQALTSLPSNVFWNIFDVKQNRLFAEWTEIEKGMLMVGSLNINSRLDIATLLPNMKNAKVVFGIKNQLNEFETYFSIPIGPLCQNYSSHFVDLTNTSKKACEVKAEEIPNVLTECKELATELLNYVKDGLLNCTIAKKQYTKKGCGNLTCP
jgi:hypothetical protein